MLLVAGSTIAIFNYQKSNSSAVNSTLYALRTSDEARRVLGDEIYFASRIPYIWGTIDQLHGHIDIQFSVKGTREKALMKFKSVRKSRMGMVSFISRYYCNLFFFHIGSLFFFLQGDQWKWYIWRVNLLTGLLCDSLILLSGVLQCLMAKSSTYSNPLAGIPLDV